MIWGKVFMEDSLIRKRIGFNPIQHSCVFHNYSRSSDNAAMHHPTTAQILKRLMARKNHISENELERQTGVPQPTINRILKGESKEPKQRTLQRLADFFEVTVPQLRGEEPLDSAPAVPAEAEASRPTVDLSALIDLMSEELANVTAEEFRQALVRLFERKAAKALPPPAITYGGPSHRQRRPKPKKGSKDSDAG